jgi:hypothetical protein
MRFVIEELEVRILPHLFYHKFKGGENMNVAVESISGNEIILSNQVRLIFGPEEPVDKNAIWIDTDNVKDAMTEIITKLKKNREVKI